MWKRKDNVGVHDTSHTSVERRHWKNIAVIKELLLALIQNAKLNDTAQKMMWVESLHMY